MSGGSGSNRVQRWSVAQSIAAATLYVAVIILAFSIGQHHYYGLPLVALFYGLHWRWQGVAFRLDYPKSEQFVAMIKFQQSTTRADW